MRSTCVINILRQQYRLSPSSTNACKSNKAKPNISSVRFPLDRANLQKGACKGQRRGVICWPSPGCEIGCETWLSSRPPWRRSRYLSHLLPITCTCHCQRSLPHLGAHFLWMVDAHLAFPQWTRLSALVHLPLPLPHLAAREAAHWDNHPSSAPLTPPLAHPPRMAQAVRNRPRSGLGRCQSPFRASSRPRSSPAPFTLPR